MVINRLIAIMLGTVALATPVSSFAQSERGSITGDRLQQQQFRRDLESSQFAPADAARRQILLVAMRAVLSDDIANGSAHASLREQPQETS